VVTLDLEMPRMDGMETLRLIVRNHKIPVIVVSAHTQQGASATFKALATGAFDFVAKPRDAASAHLEEISTELVGKIKVAAQTGVGQSRMPAIVAEPRRAVKPASKQKRAATKVVGIGISTGGPNALQYVLSQLPGDFPGTILVVQHMPEGFTEL